MRNLIARRTVDLSILYLSLCASAAAGATATFVPTTPTTVEAGIEVVFEVTVSVAALTEFNSADVIIGSNDASDVVFEYSPEWMAAFSTITTPLMDVGFYAQDVFVGGNNGTPVGSAMLLGTVTLQTNALINGVYAVVIDNSFDGISTLGLDGVPEPLDGAALFTIVGGSDCPPPLVQGEGSRYVAVTPAGGATPVGIYVTGVGDASCVAGYVQSNGIFLRDGSSPTNLVPGLDGWGTVHVRGNEIIGGETYAVQTDCDPSNPGTNLSDPVIITMWRYGDLNNDGTVDFIDIGNLVDGFRHIFTTLECCYSDADCISFGPDSICDVTTDGCPSLVPPAPGTCTRTLQNLDIIGSIGGLNCLVDGVIDFTDIGNDVDAFRSIPDPCRTGVNCP